MDSDYFFFYSKQQERIGGFILWKDEKQTYKATECNKTGVSNWSDAIIIYHGKLKDLKLQGEY